MLTAKKVDTIFRDCLFKDGEDITNYIKAEGLVHPVGFNPERLESHKVEIRELLMELPTEFMKSGGGGWSALNMVMDKHGNQWAEHINMEQLVQLGEATGLVTCQLPRDLWSALPGGMPYYVVNDA